MPKRSSFAPVLLIILFATVLVQLPLAIADRNSGYDFIDPIIDVRSILVEHYVEVPDEEQMLQAAIRAMIDTLDDPHTVYVPPTRERDFNKDLRGTYVGIGAEVNIIDDYLTIMSPMDDSPALEAGVRAGDTVIEIEGESTFQLPVNDCIDRLLGEPNTPVKIRVRHKDGEEEDITVIRRRIIARTVKGIMRNGLDWHHCVDPDAKISYARVTQFNGTTVQELRFTLDQLLKQGMQGFILDLRDNPGGALSAAVEMADMFLDEGKILEIKPRQGRGQPFSASAAGTLPDFPMIVLLNGASASASEIVAGALQDHGRAKVLGTRSFGKGSVQEVRQLDYNRGTLKYTNAYYYLPSGRMLHRHQDGDDTRWGIDPDPGLVVTESDQEYVDRILARRPFAIIGEPDDTLPACVGREWIEENFQDHQLVAATDALVQVLADKGWPTITELDPAQVALDQELTRLSARRAQYARQLDLIDESIAKRQTLAEAAGAEPLLPEDAELIAGTLTVRDKDGNVVGEYRIDGGDVETALHAVQLTPITPPAIPED